MVSITKKIFSTIVLSLFLFSFVSAIGTETQTTFIIGGCSTTYNNQQITAPYGSCYENPGSEANRRFYCTADGYFIDTMLPSDGCSLNRNVLPTPPSSSCCPQGYYCSEDSPHQCVQRTEACSTLEVSECEAQQCIWVGELDECVETLYDLSCGFYDNQPDCEDDNLSLARVGIGSDVVGSSVECGGAVYSISEDKSSCIWDDSYPDGEKCHLNYVAEESLGGSGSFQCSNVYTLGECVNGEQSVAWESASDVISGGLTDVPEECLAALGCSGGEETRYCGEETIKLPGFSLFSLIASISIIGIWYFVKSARFK